MNYDTECPVSEFFLENAISKQRNNILIKELNIIILNIEHSDINKIGGKYQIRNYLIDTNQICIFNTEELLNYLLINFETMKINNETIVNTQHLKNHNGRLYYNNNIINLLEK